MNNIILKTKRLQLEVIDESHFENLCKLLSNEKIQVRYRDDGYSFWAVIRKNDNAFLGICGVLKQIIDGQIESEIGYRLSDSYWCNGFGTEAAKGCIDYAKEKLVKESVISLVRSINLPSIRVAKKNGFQFEKETMFHGLPHELYRLKLK